MLYALNLYIDVCQLFFNKTGGKRQDVLDKMIDTYQLKEKNSSEIVTQRYGQLFFDEAQAIQSSTNGVETVGCPHSKKSLFTSYTKIS